MHLISRRKFLEVAGGATALGSIGAPATSRSKASPRYGLGTFHHVVVLMLENRSFDNLLGYLYDPLAVPRNQGFEGVLGKDLSNPIPPYAEQADRRVVRVEKGYEMDSPNPDPGEEYTHVNTQLYGTVLPERNRYKNALQTVSPFNLPEPVPSRAPMNGFLMDYIDNFRATVGREPGYNEYKRIMHCFAPDAVPVISTLAQQFAVCDHWHCEVPSQTFCNRSFFHQDALREMVTAASDRA